MDGSRLHFSIENIRAPFFRRDFLRPYSADTSQNPTSAEFALLRRSRYKNSMLGTPSSTGWRWIGLIVMILSFSPIVVAQNRQSPQYKEIRTYFTEPEGFLNVPNDREIENEVARLINESASGSNIRIAVYSWTRTRISDRLLAAAARNVDIKVIIDHDNRDSSGNHPAAIQQLIQGLPAGSVIECNPDNGCIGSHNNHNKFMLVSELQSGVRHVVAQSSANFTSAQLRKHNNMVTIHNDKALYDAYLLYWNDMSAKVPDSNYYWTQEGDFRTEAYFFPRASGDTVVDILDQLDGSAGGRVRIAMSLWDDGRLAIVQALRDLQSQGCSVEVITREDQEAVDDLDAEDIPIYLFPADGDGTVHSKYILIEGLYGTSNPKWQKNVWTGSPNFRGVSHYENDEALLKLEDHEEIYDRFMANWEYMKSRQENSSAANDHFASAVASGDFNGDGYADLALGIPDKSISGLASAGAVNVYYGSSGGLSSSGKQFWHQNSAGVKKIAKINNRFGASLASGDFDNDGYEDLAIGVPGETINGTAEAGSAQIFYGSAAGLTAVGDTTWDQDLVNVPNLSEAGDHFGASLASGDLNGDGYADLAVGVPDEKMNGDDFAGAVNVFYGSASGLTDLNSQIWHQDKSGTLGAAEIDEHYGTAVAIGDVNQDGFDDLAIGVPGQNVNGIINAGEIVLLLGSAGGVTESGNQLWNQDSAGIKGVPQANEYFGESLICADFDSDGYADLAIGVPGDVVNTFQDAGCVNVLFGSSSGLSAVDQRWHQDEPGLSAAAEAGDRFGAAVTHGDFNGDGFMDLYIGVPGEALSTTTSAGTSKLLYGSSGGLTATNCQAWHQNKTGILGTAEINDRLGTALGAGDYNGDGFTDIAIGVPNDDVNTAVDAGAANIIYGSAGGTTSTDNQLLTQDT